MNKDGTPFCCPSPSWRCRWRKRWRKREVAARYAARMLLGDSDGLGTTPDGWESWDTMSCYCCGRRWIWFLGFPWNPA